MSLTKNNTIQILTIIITFSSEIVFAAEKNGSSSPYAIWPIILLFVILFVFRKKLFEEATVHQEQHEQKTETAVQEAAVAKKQVAVEKTTTAKKKPAAKKASTTKATKTAAAKPKKAKTVARVIDITDDSKQCQASTAKGSRCKRTTTLEQTTVKVDGTTYKLIVCSQHKIPSLKPFLK